MAIVNIKSDSSNLFIQDWSGNTKDKPAKYQIGNTVVYVEELRTGLKKNWIEQEVVQTEKYFKTTLMHILREEEFEDGKISKSENFVADQLKLHGVYVKEWLSELYADKYADETSLIKIVKLVSRLNFKSLNPVNISIVLSSLPHKNIEVSEAALCVLENWNNKDALKYLENTKMHDEWLDNYRLKVISDIKEEISDIKEEISE